MQSIHDAAARINSGQGDAFIAGGVESMSRVPMTGFNPMPNPELADEAMTSMGITAENLSKRHEIGRDAQEEFAIESQTRAAAARESGAFSDDTVAIETIDRAALLDGCITPGTHVQALLKLGKQDFIPGDQARLD